MYTLRVQRKSWWNRRTAGALSAVAVVLGLAGAVGYHKMFVQAEPDANVTVQALWPTANAAVDGKVTFKFTVSGLTPDQYEPFWAVDNGTWNRMAADDTNSAVMTATVDVSSWKWRADNTYPISFVALIKGSWKPVSTTVSMKIGTTPAQQQAAAAAAAAQAATVAAAQKQAAAVTAAQVQAQAAAQAAAAQAAGGILFADPTTSVSRAISAQAAADPANAGRLLRMAAQPIAEWYGGWNSDVRGAANAYVSAAAAVNQIPVLVAYNIPDRDCGSHSAGGSNGVADYLAWVRAMAGGIGNRKAIVVVEPDALAQLDCLSASAQDNRLSMISQAVAIFKANAGTTVYIDAGNPGWPATDVIAGRLKAANIAQADGFALNVSNFVTTNQNLSWGNQLSKLVGGKHYVVDTSRNGNGATADNQWCNPSGRALGQTPTLQTNNALADAYLWIKQPGTSDGQCGATIAGSTAPQAGFWWPQYALDLLKGAGW